MAKYSQDRPISCSWLLEAAPTDHSFPRSVEIWSFGLERTPSSPRGVDTDKDDLTRRLSITTPWIYITPQKSQCLLSALLKSKHQRTTYSRLSKAPGLLFCYILNRTVLHIREVTSQKASTYFNK